MCHLTSYLRTVARADGERHHKEVVSFPYPEELAKDVSAASEEERQKQKRMEQDEASAKEEIMLVKHFEQRLSFNKKQMEGVILTKRESRRRPPEGWSYLVEELGREHRRGLSGGKKFVALPDGSQRDLNELEKMFVKRETVIPRRRRLRTSQLASGRFPLPPQRALRQPPGSGAAATFAACGLSEELLAAVAALSLKQPTEIQALGIPPALAGENLVMASHTGSGKTLAYLLPVVQSLRRDEAALGKPARPKRPRAVVLCPTRELAEQVLAVAKSLCHHARFRSAMIGGGSPMKQQENALGMALDLVVGTPGRILQHVKEGHMSLSDIRYIVLDEADTMFDKGFGPEIRSFVGPLRNRQKLLGIAGFQTIMVTATITKSVHRLLDEEFPGICHIRTSSLHKRIATARHDFLPVSGNENKLDTLLQILEPSLSRGHRVMVFCNTISSCRAADHFLAENDVATVNYHGEVPAEERVKNLQRFREEPGDVDNEELAYINGCRVPALVCTDLAARGLDLAVDHIIMFDFPHTTIDYLHRTGRTARNGAKGRITSLVTKKDQTLAMQLEVAISKGEPLEELTGDRAKLEAMRKREAELRRRQKEAAVPTRGVGMRRRLTADAPVRGGRLARGTRGAARMTGASKPSGSRQVAPTSRGTSRRRD
eukprot:SM000082S22892  [mRNA]  locus=s82:393706:399992:- [translate_table: standard]